MPPVGGNTTLPIFFPEKESFDPTLWDRKSKGVFSFAKENTPFGTPRERLDWQFVARRGAVPLE